MQKGEIVETGNYGTGELVRNLCFPRYEAGQVRGSCPRSFGPQGDFLCIGIKDLLYEVVPGSNVRMFSRMRPDGPDGNEIETLK